MSDGWVHEIHVSIEFRELDLKVKKFRVTDVYIILV